MCNFLSAIVMKNGDIFIDSETGTSHESIIRKFNLRDTILTQNRFVRVEFIPYCKNIQDTSLWELEIDEDVIPTWCEKDKIKEKLKSIVKNNILIQNQNLKLLNKGYYILVDSTVEEITDRTIIRFMINSKIKNLKDYSSVINMLGNSVIENMSNHTCIINMCDNSIVENVKVLSTIGYVRNHSKIINMEDFSKVDTLTNYSCIENMTHNATLGFLECDALVKNITGNAKILNHFLV